MLQNVYVSLNKKKKLAPNYYPTTWVSLWGRNRLLFEIESFKLEKLTLAVIDATKKIWLLRGSLPFRHLLLISGLLGG